MCKMVRMSVNVIEDTISQPKGRQDEQGDNCQGAATVPLIM